jgi:hypothetical protein
MTENSPATLPQPQYKPLRLPDGTHSGVCYDPLRGVLEIQRKGTKYYFDLAVMYNANQRNGDWTKEAAG